MRKANITTLASVIVIALVAAGVGMGTMAYFSDTETSTGNTVTAGTMDLELIVPTFTLTDIFPCKELDPVTFTFQNDGSIPGYFYYRITYTENDNLPNTVDLNADAFAALIYVEAVTYEHYTLAGSWTGSAGDDLPKWLDMDLNSDGYVSLYEMKGCDWLAYCDEDDPLPVGDGGRFIITFHMADSLASYPGGAIEFNVEDNWPQDDGIDVTFTAVLRSSAIPP